MCSYLTSVTFRSSCGSYCNENNSVLATLGILLAERFFVSKTRYSNMTKNESNLVFVAIDIIIHFVKKIKFLVQFIPHLKVGDFLDIRLNFLQKTGT